MAFDCHHTELFYCEFSSASYVDGCYIKNDGVCCIMRKGSSKLDVLILFCV